MKTSRFAVACLLFVLTSAFLTTPAFAQAKLPEVPTSVAGLLQDREFEKAIAAIDKELAKPDVKHGDYLSYLRARAFHFQKKYDDAIKAFDAMAAKHPKSDWARRARFGKGVSLAAKGDFRGAEQIYRTEAGFLLSPDRKQEMSAIYLEFADAYFKPPKEEVKPNYQRALNFYQRALSIGPKPERATEVELRIAMCNQKLNKHGQAITLLEAFVKKHADESLVVEARFQLGDSQLAANRLQSARATWQDLLRIHAGSDSPRLPEAAFRISLTYGIPQPKDIEQLNLGVGTLKSFIAKYPKHKLASLAYLRIGQSYQNLGRFDDAVTNLAAFLGKDQYAKTEEFAEARFNMAYALKMQQKFDDALKTWQSFLVKHPTHKLWSNAQREIINTEYLKADYAYSRKKYDEATQQWTLFLAKYPLDQRSPAILFRLGQIKYEQDKFDDAIQQWRRLVSKYPKTEDSARGQLMIGVTLERKLDKLEEALEEYRKVKWGKAQKSAALAVARLTRKTMAIATTRVFRTNEAPAVKLTSRNIEKFKVQIYSIDLETYFRKMHVALGVESLDIALIDPDQSFDYSVPKYRKYKQVENEITIPLDDKNAPAVMAVTVSSEKLESTTLVLRSDLDIIVKSSREELFVFAQNMKTGKPWSKVRILASNGTRVFAEGTTNDDGVYHKSFEELHKAGNVRVFAIADRHSAANVIPLNGLGRAQGLAAKGLIYTERSAYRPGQMVHLRGVIRNVEGDVYVSPAGKKYELQVFNSRSQLIHKEELTTSKLGTFHSRLQLPKATPLGVCRILVTGPDRERYQGAFQVHQQAIDSVRLTVKTDRDVYYRGEKVKGSISAAFYYGAPVVGKNITYSLTGMPAKSGVTDDEGKVYFEFETRRFRESAKLRISAVLPERNLSATKQLLLATQAFQIRTSLVRSVYLAEEPFEFEIKTLDPLEKPVAKELTVKILRVVEDKAPTAGERLVETLKTKTDAQGLAKLALKVKEGGTYIVRVEGLDRFNNAVTHQESVQISDKTDKIRLRILANRHTFKTGETAKVQVLWREKPALALVTYQGARVLGYRLERLNQGLNQIEVPMTAKLAPNFALHVSVMQPFASKSKAEQKDWQGLHTADTEFTVTRELKVNVALQGPRHPQPPRPGDSVRVVVTTTNPQGKPVAAELSVGMVEQALLSRFPHRTSMSYFNSRRRRLAVRTTSSAIFFYRPTTQPINKQLLAHGQPAGPQQGGQMGGFGGFGGGGFGGGGMAGGGASGGAAFGGRRPAGSSRAGQRPFTTSVVPTVDGDDPFAENAEPSAGPGDFRSTKAPGNRTKSVDKNANGGKKGAGKNGSGAREAAAPGNAIDDTDATGGAILVHAMSDLRALFDEALGDIALVDQNGTWEFINLQAAIGREWDEKKAAAVVKTLAARKALLLPRLPVHETGFWNPAVVTDANGKAEIAFTVPQRSTAWTVSARGITADTLTGQADYDFSVRRDLFGELRVASAYTDGDEAQLRATIYNGVLDKGDVDVELQLTVGGKTTIQRKKVAVTKKGSLVEATFQHKMAMPNDGMRSVNQEDVALQLTVRAGDEVDVTRRTVPLRPNGVPVFAVASGSASGTRTAFLDPPKDIVPSSARLQVTVGPTVEQSLVDVVLRPNMAAFCSRMAGGYSPQVDRAASDLMAALALQKLLTKTQQADSPQLRSVDARIRALVADLVARQLNEGGWSWTSRAGDRYTTAQVVWGLSLAKDSGYLVPDENYARAVKYLQSQVARSKAGDYETKVVLLHGLAAAGEGDFTLANQLYRNRRSLSTAGLARLALAFAEMDRKATAGELVTLIGERDLKTLSEKGLGWAGSELEVRALYSLALEKLRTADGKLKAQVDWLMEHRSGERWMPEKATGPAMLTLCSWFARTQFQGAKYELTIYVNDLKAFNLSIDENSATQMLDVPENLLQVGRQRVRFEINGRGRYTYNCVLSGFVPSEKAKSTNNRWVVRRFYEPAPLEVDGKAVPRGFGIVRGTFRSFRNDMTQLPVEKRGTVRLELSSNTTTSYGPEGREYLVITEPIPAGASVIQESIRGGFEHYEIRPGEIVFYLGRRGTQISYDVFGTYAGSYQSRPTLVRNVYRLDELAVGKPRQLKILARGANSEDEYRLSPVELFELGRRAFADKQHAKAAQHLNELIEKWTLNAGTYQQVVKMLLDIHLVQGPPQGVVKYFEIIIEKYPNLPITFEDYLKIGAAYDKLGEYERSYLVYRATIEANFQRESFVAGSLESEGDFSRSVAVMSDVLRQYPPESYLASATYALAQRVYGKSADAAKDAKLKEQKITREQLIERAIRRLDHFLSDNPLDPAADQASFSVASGLLELEQYKLAIQACLKYADRYAESSYLDSFWYIIGFCHYANGDHKDALEMVKRVSQRMWKNPKTTRMEESRNKWRAIYIAGQIHHSRGEAAKAIEEYERVKDRFVDARQAIDYFARKSLKMPEVTTVNPKDPVKFELTYRNIKKCTVTVYRIDLLKFGLMRRSLNGIADINLAGIRPQLVQEIPLGDGKDYRDRKKQVQLPIKGEGAYLIVCRGDDIHSSGMFLISPLRLEVRESRNGRVRTTVKDTVADNFVSDVEVKVIGSGNKEFKAGETDLRGVFVTDGVVGQTMVIARVGKSRYAFFRGEKLIGSRAGFLQNAPNAADGGMPNQKPFSKSQLLEGLMDGNKRIQAEQQQQLDELYKGLDSGQNASEGQGKGGQGGGFGGGFGGGGIF